jgi:hypothetical protein
MKFMALKDQLTRIASVNEKPCVTVSLNTHRTHPDNQKDEIVLKNLLKDAENRLLSEYNKRDIDALLTKISTLPETINFNYNLDSLHIFLSNDFEELIKSTWPTPEDKVEINENFSVRPLIKDYNRSEEYLILQLTQNDIHLYEAMNDGIIKEVTNDTFPFNNGNQQINHSDTGFNESMIENRLKELFNRIDKAVVNVYNETDLPIIVIASDQNYKLLTEVADRPDIYVGHSTIDNNKTKEHEIADQAWAVVKDIQFKSRSEAIGEVKEGISKGLALTDLQEIYQAAIDGRGELLVVNMDYHQAVKMIDDRTFDLVEDSTEPDVIDDIVTTIAWEVLSKKGRVAFTRQEELSELGEITLRTRY